MSSLDLRFGPAPHLHSGDSVPKVMTDVVVALMPAVIWAVYIFGPGAVMTLVTALVGAVAVEAIWQRCVGRPSTIGDGSALVTGLILALNVPANLPWWMTLSAVVIAIVFGKQVYGGLGHNPFNPAAVGRVFLLLSFPVAMTAQWQDAFAPLRTAATPLGILKNHGAAQLPSWDLLFFGMKGGSMGEISVFLLLLGAAYLLWRRRIGWEVPVSFLGTMAVVAFVFWRHDPARFASPLFHLLTGGAVIGAFFMATDMVTMPLGRKARLVFGCGCGLITMMIRLWGGYPEGVSFAILIMNALAPMLERYLHSPRFGVERVA